MNPVRHIWYYAHSSKDDTCCIVTQRLNLELAAGAGGVTG